ncbi:MAG: immunoglobulin domain-containing protein [Cyclobacteriaceae bacterium]|nr:immunoglobulin domain-containing protein [Cyclobacteriaceae bacterium]
MKKIYLFCICILQLTVQLLHAQPETQPGNAINFTGSNYILVPAHTSLDFTVGTVEAWVKPTWTSPPSGTPCIVGIATSPSTAANTRWSFHINNGLNQIGIWNGVSGYFFSYSFTANTLYHVAAVMNGTTITIYVNGVQVGSTNGTMSNAIGISMKIGTSTGSGVNDFFRGDIDEVRLWNVARTAQQIQESMHLTLTGSETGLVSYYQFNETSGTTANDAQGTNHGTLTNSPSRVASTFPVGGGASATMTESIGTVNFTGTDFTGIYSTSGSASITASVINAAQPNTLPSHPDISSIYGNQYWVVNRFGGSAYNANFRFKTSEDLTGAEAAAPSKVQLYARAMNSAGAWTLLGVASSVDAANDYATFNNITLTNPGQCILVKGSILTTGSVSSPQCAGATINITYDADGITFNAGNTFTVQLSNASGSFASPVNIGSITGTSATGTIPVTLSQYIAPGTQYRIRVVSSNPARTGLDNGSNITITNPIDAAGYTNILSGLVAYYPFDGNAIDAGPNSFNGSIVGGVTATTDHYGTGSSAMNFNGSNSGIDVGDYPALRMYSSFSISVWIKPASLGNNYTIVTKYFNNESYKLRINTSGQVVIDANNVSVIGTAQALTANQWSHIVATVTSGQWRIYKDNVLIGSSSAGVTLTDSFGPFQIGKDGGSQRFPGDMDELRVYNRVLSAAEVQVLYNNGIASNNGPVCEDGTVSLGALNVSGSPSFSWTGPNGFTSSAQNPPTFTNATASLSGIYSLTVTKNGCASVPQRTVIAVNAAPAAPGGSDNGRCSNGTVTLTATGGANGNYRWYTVASGGSPIGGQTNSTYTTPSLSVTTPYWVSHMVSGCESPRTQLNAIIDTPISTGLTVNGSGSLCSGNATVTVLSSEATATYQAFKGSTAVSSVVNGGGDITLTVPSANLTAGSNIIKVTATKLGCGSADLTNTVDIILNVPVTITAQPSNQNGCTGQGVSFSVTAIGTSLTYQWRKGTTNLSNGGNISGATSATLSLSNLVAGDAGNYNCVVSGACPSVTSNNAVLTVNASPTITAQPANDTKCAGQTATFSVTATGTSISYQWRKGTTNLNNGGNISGATSATLTLTNIATTDAGNYNCVISSSVGCNAVTSNNGVLTVNTAPAITAHPANDTQCAGASSTFSVTATGTGLIYQWRKGTTNLSNGGNISGATSATLTLSNLVAGDAGNYNCVVSGTCSPSVTSNNGALTISTGATITSHPNNDAKCVGASSTFTVTANGTGLTYQWRKGTTNLSNGGNISGATSATLSLTNITTADAGNYNCIVTASCGSPVTSNNGVLTVNTSPAITAQPSDDTKCVGTSATFTVTATGTGLIYQWRKGTTNLSNGGNISGATSATLTLSNLVAGDAGNYNCVVSGTCSPSVTSNNAALTVNISPAVTGQPSNDTKCVGASSTFSVTATGTGLTYQWRKGTTNLSNGGNISGATSATLTLSNLVAGDAGNYNCVVSGTCSPAVTSNNGVLTVNTLPAITSHPSNDTKCAGASSTFSVTATGTGLTYQWRNGTTNLANGGNISGATSATLTLSNLVAGDAGNYNCVVSGTCSPSVTSNNGVLTVNISPAITSQPANDTKCAGGSSSFSVSATGTGLTYQWRKGTTNLSNGGNISGATSATLTLSNLVTGDAGNYNCVVSGTCSPAVTSNNAVLTVNISPAITSQPSGDTKCVGASAAFTVTATGTGLSYQWRKGTTNLVSGGDISGATSATLMLSNLSASDAGDYNCVVSGVCSPAVTSGNASLTVNAPAAITNQPFNDTQCAGGSASFSVTATGVGLTYQWRKGTTSLVNGGNVSGATSATLTLSNLTAGDAGNYNCVVSGTCGLPATSSIAALAISNSPVITAQPAGATKTSGESVSFTLTATGTSLTYQWRKGTSALSNDSKFSGTTTSTLTISNLTLADAGDYNCVVTSACGNTTSGNATLIVNKAVPTITFTSLLVEGKIGEKLTISASSSSPAEIIFEITGGTGTGSFLSPGLLRLESPGTIEITASQVSTADYDAATASQIITVLDMVTAAEDPEREGVLVFPNPAGSEVTIRSSDADRLYLVDARGITIREWEIHAGEITIDITEISPALYLLKGQRGNNIVFLKRIVKK